MIAALPASHDQDEFRFELVEGWGRLPDGWSLKEIGGIGIDRNDNVYVFNRGDHPVVVFDREGNFRHAWGEGRFPRAHGVHMGPDDSIYLTDDGAHTVGKFTLDGRLLLEIGTPGCAAPFMSGEPFNRCTHTALAPNGDIYVADGYGNARIHRFTPDGRWLCSWGESGSGPGQFNIVHNICCDADGWIYVADRENHRIQVFDGDGGYETQWNSLHRPCGLFMPAGTGGPFYVGELGPALGINRDYPNLGPRVSVLDGQGRLLARLGGAHPGLGPDDYIGPHGLATDSRGDLYVGEVSRTQWPNYWAGQPVPPDLRCLRKLRRIRSTR